jgi:hypothetical protein
VSVDSNGQNNGKQSSNSDEDAEIDMNDPFGDAEVNADDEGESQSARNTIGISDVEISEENPFGNVVNDVNNSCTPGGNVRSDANGAVDQVDVSGNAINNSNSTQADTTESQTDALARAAAAAAHADEQYILDASHIFNASNNSQSHWNSHSHLHSYSKLRKGSGNETCIQQCLLHLLAVSPVLNNKITKLERQMDVSSTSSSASSISKNTINSNSGGSVIDEHTLQTFLGLCINMCQPCTSSTANASTSASTSTSTSTCSTYTFTPSPVPLHVGTDAQMQQQALISIAQSHVSPSSPSSSMSQSSAETYSSTSSASYDENVTTSDGNNNEVTSTSIADTSSSSSSKSSLTSSSSSNESSSSTCSGDDLLTKSSYFHSSVPLNLCMLSHSPSFIARLMHVLTCWYADNSTSSNYNDTINSNVTDIAGAVAVATGTSTASANHSMNNNNGNNSTIYAKRHNHHNHSHAFASRTMSVSRRCLTLIPLTESVVALMKQCIVCKGGLARLHEVFQEAVVAWTQILKSGLAAVTCQVTLNILQSSSSSSSSAGDILNDGTAEDASASFISRIGSISTIVDSVWRNALAHFTFFLEYSSFHLIANQIISDLTHSYCSASTLSSSPVLSSLSSSTTSSSYASRRMSVSSVPQTPGIAVTHRASTGSVCNVTIADFGLISLKSPSDSMNSIHGSTVSSSANKFNSIAIKGMASDAVIEEELNQRWIHAQASVVAALKVFLMFTITGDLFSLTMQQSSQIPFQHVILPPLPSNSSSSSLLSSSMVNANADSTRQAPTDQTGIIAGSLDASSFPRGLLSSLAQPHLSSLVPSVGTVWQLVKLLSYGLLDTTDATSCISGGTAAHHPSISSTLSAASDASDVNGASGVSEVVEEERKHGSKSIVATEMSRVLTLANGTVSSNTSSATGALINGKSTTIPHYHQHDSNVVHNALHLVNQIHHINKNNSNIGTPNSNFSNVAVDAAASLSIVSLQSLFDLCSRQHCITCRRNLAIIKATKSTPSINNTDAYVSADALTTTSHQALNATQNSSTLSAFFMEQSSNLSKMCLFLLLQCVSSSLDTYVKHERLNTMSHAKKWTKASAFKTLVSTSVHVNRKLRESVLLSLHNLVNLRLDQSISTWLLSHHSELAVETVNAADYNNGFSSRRQGALRAQHIDSDDDADDEQDAFDDVDIIGGDRIVNQDKLPISGLQSKTPTFRSKNKGHLLVLFPVVTGCLTCTDTQVQAGIAQLVVLTGKELTKAVIA